MNAKTASSGDGRAEALSRIGSLKRVRRPPSWCRYRAIMGNLFSELPFGRVGVFALRAAGRMAGSRWSVALRSSLPDALATFVANDGTVRKTLPLGLSGSLFVGDFDGEGVTDMLQNPLELSQLEIGGALDSSIGLSGRRIPGSNEVALFFSQKGAIARGLVTGCSPLPTHP